MRHAAERSGLPWGGYVLAAAAVCLAFIVRLAVGPYLGDRSPFLIFVLPVSFAVLAAGRGPGLLAGCLSVGAAFSIVPAAERYGAATMIEASLFIMVCMAIGWLEARRAGQSIAASDARRQLELLVEGATDYAMLMLDPGGNILTWNKGAERLMGLPRKLAIGKHSSIFLAGSDAPAQIVGQLDKARRSGRFAGEVWHKRVDGSEFLAEVTVRPVVAEGERNLGFVKIVHDVTAARAEKRALERREEHLNSILATVPDAMVVIDETGIILSFSSAAERLFGYGGADVTGKNVSILMPSPDRDRHDSYLSRYLESGVPRIIGIGRIVTGLRADGSTFPMALSVGEAKSSDQRLFTGFIQDLTERRDFETRLEQLQSELIHVSRLSAMGTMASTLAHELNQPLTAIASYGEAAAALLESGEQLDTHLLQEIVTDMAQQSLRAGRIVRRLREFVSRGDLDKKIEDLPKVIEEASALALVGAREKGVATHFDLSPKATPVLIDRVQIQQVLINLMRNAIDAMEGTRDKRLEVSTTLLDSSTVQVSVADTGIGISPAIREHLFDAFNSSKDGGMGLGLSICRTIIEAHGGRIEAQDRKGGGTEFRFTLIRAHAEND